MNQLSWIIYLADVAGTAKGLCLTAVILSGVVFAAMAFAAMIMSFDSYGDDALKPWKDLGNRAKKWAWVPAVAGLAMALVPSQGTLYAIAASEMGERALKSETGGKAVEALNAWLDRQIAGPKSE